MTSWNCTFLTGMFFVPDTFCRSVHEKVPSMNHKRSVWGMRGAVSHLGGLNREQIVINICLVWPSVNKHYNSPCAGDTVKPINCIALQIPCSFIKLETIFHINKASAGKFMAAIQLLHVLRYWQKTRVYPLQCCVLTIIKSLSNKNVIAKLIFVAPQGQFVSLCNNSNASPVLNMGRIM